MKADLPFSTQNFEKLMHCYSNPAQHDGSIKIHFQVVDINKNENINIEISPDSLALHLTPAGADPAHLQGGRSPTRSGRS